MHQDVLPDKDQNTVDIKFTDIKYFLGLLTSYSFANIFEAESLGKGAKRSLMENSMSNTMGKEQNPGAWQLVQVCLWVPPFQRPSRMGQRLGPPYYDLVDMRYRMPIEYLIYAAVDAILIFNLAHAFCWSFIFENYASVYSSTERLSKKIISKNLKPKKCI